MVKIIECAFTHGHAISADTVTHAQFNLKPVRFPPADFSGSIFTDRSKNLNLLNIRHCAVPEPAAQCFDIVQRILFLIFVRESVHCSNRNPVSASCLHKQIFVFTVPVVIIAAPVLFHCHFSELSGISIFIRDRKLVRHPYILGDGTGRTSVDRVEQVSEPQTACTHCGNHSTDQYNQHNSHKYLFHVHASSYLGQFLNSRFCIMSGPSRFMHYCLIYG